MTDLHNFNPGRKSWKMYANTITSISSDDLTITPYDGEDLILEVSGNGNIIFKEDGRSYTMADLSNVASSGGSGSVVEANGGFRSLTTDTNVGTNSISIGYQCGNSSQGTKSIAIGYECGYNSQGSSSIAIGGAGVTNQGSQCVAIGYQCANNYQGQHSIAIGPNSQRIIQNQQNVVSIGYGSAELYAKTGSVSVGTYAGQNGGQYSLNLGYYANRQGNHNNTITLNATGVAVNSTQSDTFVVKPIRNATGSSALFYNSSSGEITYDSAVASSGGGDSSFNNVDISGTLKVNNIITSESLDVNGNIKVNDTIKGSGGSLQKLDLYTESSSQNSTCFNEMRHDKMVFGGPLINMYVNSSTTSFGNRMMNLESAGVAINKSSGAASHPLEVVGTIKGTGDLIIDGDVTATSGTFRGMAGTVCKIHVMTFSNGNNISSNSYGNITTQSFSKTAGTQFLVEVKYDYEINGWGSDSFITRLFVDGTDATSNSISQSSGEQTLIYQGAGGGSHRSSSLNDTFLVSTDSSSYNNAYGAVTIYIQAARYGADDTITVNQGIVKVTEIWV